MATTDTALEGLDALEQPRVGTGNGASSLATRAWRATWPKLAAIALVLLIWEIIAASGWKKLIFPAPPPPPPPPAPPWRTGGTRSAPACAGTRSAPRCTAR